VVALCEGQRVDLCAFTGDYWFGQADEPRGSLRNLARILDACDARIGIFGVLGNHDVPEDAGLIEQLGIRILMNEATDIVAHGTRLHIVGVDDPSTQQDDLDRAVSNVPDSNFSVLLAHLPEIHRHYALAGADCLIHRLDRSKRFRQRNAVAQVKSHLQPWNSRLHSRVHTCSPVVPDFRAQRFSFTLFSGERRRGKRVGRGSTLSSPTL